MSTTIADEIKHLTSEQIEELYEKYRSGEKNQTLIEEYGLACTPQNLYKVFPPIMQNDMICPTCNIPMYEPRQTKSNNLRTRAYFCCKCQHKRPVYEDHFNTVYCTCDACVQDRLDEKARLEQEKVERINQQYALEQYSTYPYSSLNFMDKCYLLALCQMQGKMGNDVLKPVAFHHARFTPTETMDRQIIESLYEKQILLVNPDSQLDAFSESGEHMAFYLTEVSWVVNVAGTTGNRLSLDEVQEMLLADLSAYPNEIYKDDIKQFIFELAEADLERYVTELLISFRLPAPPDKTKLSLREILNHFSVAQAYYFCFLAARSAREFYSDGAKSRQHAVNSIPNRLLTLKNRALMDKWDVKGYKWDRDASYSQLGNTFYGVLCPDAPDVAFLECPATLWENVISQRFPTSKSEECTFACPECGSVDHRFSGDMKLLLMTCNGCGFEAGFTELEVEAPEPDMTEKMEHST
ncbi:hypothetical protein [Pseudoalteromonas sp. OOF1S-7]|uniref:hypothetical protein n=1 Tax=Pseudoalteromonas sp. OOF1S-7 TaxID=2917757 RepID=UPI001EF5525B|nr:hypothetical protein [Pseudoalteromonas sp. OOF1S-7]MCG7537910.1 hypothetical protein [Pseudoalteromonas sp. OOF1S-7]